VNKLYKKITAAKPSTLTLSFIAVALTIFLLGGGLYTIIMKPLPAPYYGGRFIFLYPKLSEQLGAENIIVPVLYSLGILGLIFIYQSTRYAYKPRQAYMMVLVGITLLLIAYMSLEAIVSRKLAGVY